MHLDGYNLLPYLTGQQEKSPRNGFIYFNDDGDIVALRFDNWKVVFSEQRVEGTFRIWAEPFVALRVPKVFNLRTDPYERADITSNSVLRVVPVSRLHCARRVGDHRAVPRVVQGVPATAEAGVVLTRSGVAADAGSRQRRRALTCVNLESCRPGPGEPNLRPND